MTIDPIRFKRLLIKSLKLLVILEVLGAFVEGTRTGGWARFGFDLLALGILYSMWERIVARLEELKRSSRKTMESASDGMTLRDALIFSLLSSDEIFRGIPPDRKRIVILSFTLIAIGLAEAYFQIGSGLIPIVVAGTLTLAGVNLVVWVVSQERTQKETLQTELRLARDVQMSLMPKRDPDVAHYDIAGLSQPASEVGGDFYDYTWLGVQRAMLGISVFDVSGKGLQAAMSAVFTSGAYAGEARLSDSPATVLSRLNHTVYQHSTRGHFTAFLLAVLDPSTGKIRFANAGQTRPILLSGNAITTLNGAGVHFPLGMKEDTEYEEEEVQMLPGDVLVLLTDGFTDAMNRNHEQYGIERIEQRLKESAASRIQSAELMGSIMRDIRMFTDGASQHDDMTMVVIQRPVSDFQGSSSLLSARVYQSLSEDD